MSVADQLVTRAAPLSASAHHLLLSVANRSARVARGKTVLDRRQARRHAGVVAVVAGIIVPSSLTVTVSSLQAGTIGDVRLASEQSAQSPVAGQSGNGEAARQVARPRFEVVSIRQCAPNAGRGGGPGSFSPRQTTINCQAVKGLIETGYLTYADGVTAQPQRVIRTPIEGGPDWITSDAYTISATTDGEATLPMMYGPMLQTILEERFKLRIRRETREIPVYALTVASGGHKLKPFVEGSCVVREPDFTQPNPLAALEKLPPLEPGQRRCMNRSMLKGSARVLEADAITLSELTNFFIGGLFDRPVIDRTGLTGKWVLRLESAPTDRDRVLAANRGEPLEPAAPSIFTAVQEQLGLRLEPARGPGEFLVIESIERPTGN